MDRSLMEQAAAYARQQLDREEWWAREASRDSLYPERPMPENGERWIWRENEGGEPIELDPATDEYIPGSPFLGSVEKYPNERWGPDPRLVVLVEEMPTTVGGHIINHDPASVLIDISIKRTIIDNALANPATHGFLVLLLVQRWRDRPDFNPAWRI